MLSCFGDHQQCLQKPIIPCRIPETLKVSSGYDGGFTLAAIGLTMSKFDFVDSDTPGVKNMFVRYYGWGNAMGLTMITGSKPDKLSTV